MLQRADTIGVFQIESRAQMATLPRMQPERFYDLVVEVAIIRPGPIVGQMVHPYLQPPRAAREPVTYAASRRSSRSSSARSACRSSRSSCCASPWSAAGFTGGEAEELRRAMGFKRSVERMREIEARLRAGMARARHHRRDAGRHRAAASPRSRSTASPRSHAASFALIAYASAYLQARTTRPPSPAPCSTTGRMGFYHPATLVKDAQRTALRVLPIDVTRSGWRCTLEQGGC